MEKEGRRNSIPFPSFNKSDTALTFVWDHCDSVVPQVGKHILNDGWVENLLEKNNNTGYRNFFLPPLLNVISLLLLVLEGFLLFPNKM